MFAFGWSRNLSLPQTFGVTDHFIDGAEAKPRHDLPHLGGDGVEKGDHIFGLALELSAQLFVQRGDPHRTSIKVALADIDAPHRDQRRSSEVVFLCSEERCANNILARPHAAVGAQRHSISQAIEQEHLVRFGYAHFPRPAGVLDRTQWRGACAALMSADQDDVRMRLGNSGRDRPTPASATSFTQTRARGLTCFRS